MKLTANQLRQIIKEEVEAAMQGPKKSSVNDLAEEAFKEFVASQPEVLRVLAPVTSTFAGDELLLILGGDVMGDATYEAVKDAGLLPSLMQAVENTIKNHPRAKRVSGVKIIPYSDRPYQE